ncbi:MAG TPA: phosphoribosyltransferase family protein [Gemmataceae bacterium]|nr:phosphoribosyltransferase family protein [Gemmataceae bacterium]
MASRNTDSTERVIRISAGPVALEGNLHVPKNALGVVLFAHGSGSGRRSPRNRFVAAELGKARLATLLVDLLTREEEAVDVKTGHLRFDIGLLAARLVSATDWLLQSPQTRYLPLGYFGASTGAAAALVAASQRAGQVGAIVSRGGRPDLAGSVLPHIDVPTLLIVGGEDIPVIDLNRKALDQLGAKRKQLVIVPGATHLFEEPGALHEVARLAADWFVHHMRAARVLYRDRAEAGRRLAALLRAYADRPDVLVLALPRGGVPVAFEVARLLHVPLDVFMVRKLGLPGQREMAMGAIATGGLRVLNEDAVRALGISDQVIEAVAAREQEELNRREQLYRGNRPAVDVRGRTVILIDDGLATGSTMRAAVGALRHLGPARIVVAVPVGAPDTCAELRNEADEALCARAPEPFHAVGLWYVDFAQITDEVVRDLLAEAAEEYG